MTKEQILKAIDDSIKKWQYIVYFKGSLKMNHYKYSQCLLCILFVRDCWIYLMENEKEIECPIYYFTKAPICRNTPFYNTSLWANIDADIGISFIPKLKFIYDNHMLSLLYDIRRKFIIDINSKKPYYNL
jgi:hypothetical protein